MGDTSNFNVHVPYIPVAYKDRIVELILQYTGGYDHYEDERAGTAVSIGANEVSLGSVEQLDSEFKELIEDGVDVECKLCDDDCEVDGEDCPACDGAGERHLDGFDFAYSINDEPAYEWLGTLVVHVPGMKDLVTECDADGSPVLKNKELMELIDTATDLENLRARIKGASGAAHFDGMKTWAAEQRKAAS